MTGSNFSGFSDILVINNPAESFEWKKRLVSSAESSIEWSFNYAGGEVFREVLSLIEVRLNENEKNDCFKIHLILSKDSLEQEDYEAINRLKEYFPEQFFYLITGKFINQDHDLLLHTEENHIKLLVVDGKYFLIGGTAVTDWAVRNPDSLDDDFDVKPAKTTMGKMMPLSCRDSDIMGRGCDENLVHHMRSEFFKLYNIFALRAGVSLGQREGKIFPIEKVSTFDFDEFSNLTPTETVCMTSDFDESPNIIRNVQTRFIVSSPEHENQPIESAYVNLIKSAQEEITIASFILIPSKKIKTALRKSSARKTALTDGGKVHFLTNARAAFSKKDCELFDSAFETARKTQCYHKKIMVVDSRHVIIGSANLGRKSLKFDYEIICVFDDTRIAKEVQDGLEKDKEHMKLRPPSTRDRVLGATFGRVIRNFF